MHDDALSETAPQSQQSYSAQAYRGDPYGLAYDAYEDLFDGDGRRSYELPMVRSTLIFADRLIAVSASANYFPCWVELRFVGSC